MTKSFLIKTSVAAIVSAFVFTAGVSSARAGGDSYREAPSNGGPLYYPNRDTGGNHVGHCPKRHSRHWYGSYSSCPLETSSAAPVQQLRRLYQLRRLRRSLPETLSAALVQSSCGSCRSKRHPRHPYNSYGSCGFCGCIRFTTRNVDSRNPYDGSTASYPKRHSRTRTTATGSYGSYGGYVGHYPKRHPRQPVRQLRQLWRL